MSEATQSKYAAKKAAGNQMYGPGCCAHRITPAQLDANRRRVSAQRKRERDEYFANKRLEKELSEYLVEVG